MKLVHAATFVAGVALVGAAHVYIDNTAWGYAPELGGLLRLDGDEPDDASFGAELSLENQPLWK